MFLEKEYIFLRIVLKLAKYIINILNVSYTYEMFNTKKRSFLFKCEDCGTILSVDFEEQEDFKKIDEDKLILECPCSGHCLVLRD